ncbi:hypothetical protein [Serpens gallinarum]|uniref:Uncharacterized protein n=1 Tax=Serpens gallinarum TaxID=2763075 RepID=A0ABR8TLS6_9PSED|nr:hypothetical protein [Serpens gallinarum]MBD7976731.1 hypothetical protein [Serpens gallinarum]
MDTRATLGFGWRTLLAWQGLAPLELKVMLLRRLGAQRTAWLAPHLPDSQLRPLIIALPSDFAAQVTQHLDPRAILNTYRSLPDELHLRVARQLCADKQFATAARYAECLTAHQLKLMILGLNDPTAILYIARHMGNMQLIMQSLRGLSAGYLRTLTEAAASTDSFVLAAEVLSGLPLARQGNVCSGLTLETLVALLPLLMEKSGGALREHLPERLRAKLLVLDSLRAQPAVPS